MSKFYQHFFTSVECSAWRFRLDTKKKKEIKKKDGKTKRKTKKEQKDRKTKR